MSAPCVVGWNQTSSWTSWFAGTNPSDGLIENSGPAALASKANLTPKSPVFCMASFLLTRLPSVTVPKDIVSVASRTSVPMLPPRRRVRDIGIVAPLIKSLSSSSKDGPRRDGLYVNDMPFACLGGNMTGVCPFQPSAGVTPSAARSSRHCLSTTQVTGSFDLFTMRISRVSLCPSRTCPKCTEFCSGLTSSRRMGDASPVYTTLTVYSPFTEKGTSAL